MFNNAELKRNIWLDFSLHRLIITPIVISLIVYLFQSMGAFGGGETTAYLVAQIYIFILGCKKASESVIDEINEKTWDFQRQSAISPWSMAWGKLIGSTLHTWYGASICFLWMAVYHTGSLLLTTIVVTILGGLFAQATTLLLSITSLEQIRHETSRKSFRYFLVGAILGYIFTKFCLAAVQFDYPLNWHNTEYNSANFMLISLILFLGWSVLGLYRTFARELQYQSLPWAWALFNAFCIYYFAGFAAWNFESLKLTNEIDGLQTTIRNSPYLIAFMIANSLSYIALLGDVLSSVRYHKIILRLDTGNVREALQQLPLWVVSATFTLLVGIIAAIQLPNLTELNINPAILVLTCLLLLARDIGIFHYFSFGENNKRALGTTLLYLFILYLLIPNLLFSMHMNHLLVVFLPSAGTNVPLAIVSLCAQVGIMGLLCYRRYPFTEKRLAVQKS